MRQAKAANRNGRKWDKERKRREEENNSRGTRQKSPMIYELAPSQIVNNHT